MRRGVTPFLGEPFRPGELAANRCRPGQFRQQLAFPDRGCWIAGDNSPCVELTRTAQAPPARLSFLLGSHPGHGPADGAGGHAQNRRALSLSRAGCQQPFQRCEPLPVQLLRPAALLPHFRSWALLWALPLATPPMRAISAAVVGL